MDSFNITEKFITYCTIDNALILLSIKSKFSIPVEEVRRPEER